ncbi:MAG: methyltransferase [Chloroflexota bacterium]
MNASKNVDRSPNERMFQLLSGYWITRAIHVAAELDIAEHLKGGPQSYEALAAATETDPSSLYRLLRALASVGIFAEVEEKRFELTPLAATLLKDTPNSLRGNAIMQSYEIYWQSWGELASSVKTGEPVFNRLFGADFFSYLSQTPEFSKRFNEGMAAITAQSDGAIVTAYDFSGISTIVDVGGGTGELLAAILKAAPHSRGILLDQPATVEQAKGIFRESSLLERCTFVEGSFFDAVPSGGNVYILKNILHDWSDEQAINILQQCRKVIGNGQKLLIMETVIPSGNEPFLGKLIDLQLMLFFKGGRERTAAEFGILLEAANFSLARVIPTFTPRVAIVEAIAK